MQVVYQYNSDGYYVYSSEITGNILPHNSTTVKPKIKKGFIPKWNGSKWTQVENHIGVMGYVDGAEFVMKEYGPLPDGFTTKKPLPTLQEAIQQAKEKLKAHRQMFEYSGFMLNGQKWDSEQKDELRLNSAYRLFERGLEKYEGWKVSDGVYVTLTPELLDSATAALMEHYSSAFFTEQLKLMELEGLTTTEEVLDWIDGKMKEGW